MKTTTDRENAANDGAQHNPGPFTAHSDGDKGTLEIAGKHTVQCEFMPGFVLNCSSFTQAKQAAANLNEMFSLCCKTAMERMQREIAGIQPGEWRATQHANGLVKVEESNRVVFDGFKGEFGRAVLAAAAPDLLAALRAVTTSGPLNNGLRDENTMALARAAIAKATGQT